MLGNESEKSEMNNRKNVSPADDIKRSEAGLFDRRIVSAVSTTVPKTVSVSSNLTAPVYLRSIMEECNGFLIRFSGFLRNPYRTRFAGLLTAGSSPVADTIPR